MRIEFRGLVDDEGPFMDRADCGLECAVCGDLVPRGRWCKEVDGDGRHWVGESCLSKASKGTLEEGQNDGSEPELPDGVVSLHQGLLSDVPDGEQFEDEFGHLGDYERRSDDDSMEAGQ